MHSKPLKKWYCKTSWIIIHGVFCLLSVLSVLFAIGRARSRFGAGGTNEGDILIPIMIFGGVFIGLYCLVMFLIGLFSRMRTRKKKYLPQISLALNIACWLLLFFMHVPSVGVDAVVRKTFVGILLIIPLTLSILSVSIKKENARITLAILATIGALLFLIPNLFIDY